MRDWLSRFMMGRYGNDELNRFLFGATMVCVVVQFLTRNRVLYYLALFLIIVGYLRMLSRNHQKRYAENMKFLAMRDKVTGILRRGPSKSSSTNSTDRKQFHIFRCPRCKQKIRIPRGRGKVRITCPKCGNTFVKRS